MSIDIAITDPESRGKHARVLNGGSLSVIDEGVPAYGQVQKSILFNKRLLNSSGSPSMNVDGSVTPVEFFIAANPSVDIDRYVVGLSFLVQGSGLTLGGNLGGAASVPNGLNIEYDNIFEEGGVTTIGQNLTTNFSLIRKCLGTPSFGDNNSAFIAGFTGVTDAIIPVLDFTRYGPQYGIRLRGGSTDQVRVIVRDDLTSVTQFNCEAVGFDRVRVE